MKKNRTDKNGQCGIAYGVTISDNNITDAKDYRTGILLSDHRSESEEINTLIHELGHLVGIEDHYEGTTLAGEPGYYANCLYGDNANALNVQQNRLICSGCMGRYLNWRNSQS